MTTPENRWDTLTPEQRVDRKSLQKAVGRMLARDEEALKSISPYQGKLLIRDELSASAIRRYLAYSSLHQ